MQPLGPAAILFDCEDASRDARKLRCQAAASGPDVEDEIARADARVSYELRS
jgi:hypothetical protein